MAQQENLFLHQTLTDRAMPEGGFAEQTGSVYRPDATAWAIMALNAGGMHGDLINPAMSRLAAGQGPDREGGIILGPSRFLVAHCPFRPCLAQFHPPSGINAKGCFLCSSIKRQSLEEKIRCRFRS